MKGLISSEAVAAVAQGQSSRLWSERSWVQIPSVAPMIVAVMVLLPNLCRGEVTVFAAASLVEVLEFLSREYGGGVRISVAASSILARQIEAGAEPDVFISAHRLWMDRVQEKGRIDSESRVSLIGNSLVVVTAYEGKGEVSFSDVGRWTALLGRRGRIAIGDPDYVPAGLYAQEALKSLGLWEGLKERLARAENVRSALSWVIRRETPLGIVYASDVGDRVAILGRFPPSSHSPIDYPMAILKGRGSREVYRWYHFLRSARAQTVYQEYGFTLLGER